MKHCLLTLLGILALNGNVSAQTNYDMQKIQKEKLNRGVVAIKQNDGKVAVLWRTLSSDKKGKPFDIYRNGKKLNNKPLTKGGTFFIDNNPSNQNTTYMIKGGGIDGSYLLNANAPIGYIPISITAPTSNMTDRRGEKVTYNANDASIADVDGDGQYEIILKWDPSNSADNSFAGYTDNTYFDCYSLDGKRLWRIDMGRNIRSGAHYIPFLVYDFDGDGKAEMMVKTSDGTIDGMGNVIGDSTKDWRSNNKDATYGRVMDGPEYLTVFNGLTGKAMKTVDYFPDRGENGSWGDTHANRSERYLAALAYLDGIHPSAVFCRGYYTRTVLAAWDWDGKSLSQHWIFDTNNKEWASYAGQGNHNLRVADVDGDGKDEITYGSMCVDDNGKGLYNTEMGHGDAIHLVADPKTNKLFIWDCHENRRDGSDFRDAATGKVVFQKPGNFDVGRAMAADIDPNNYGVEMWSANTGGLLNNKGEKVEVELKKTNENNEETDFSDFKRSRNRLSCNFAIWWDGDLTRELLDHERVTKYNSETGGCDEIIHFEGQFNNWTKSNPCLSADILGDWREEVLTHNKENTELRLYVSTIPTDYRINCLEEDIPYRESVANENVGYNQPPEVGYYIGTDNKNYLK